MANPVSGPFNRVVNVPGLYIYKSWRRQAKPYDRHLPYISTRKKITFFSDSASPGYIPSAAAEGIDASDFAKTTAANAAYSRFISRLGTNASVGVSLAEANQSVNMIANRAVAIVKGLNALKKGNLGDAASYLSKGQPPRADRRSFRGSQKKRKGRSVALDNRRREAKDWSNNYLEFHFGWSPMMQDIYDACKVLSQDFPPAFVTGTGRATSELRATHQGGREIYRSDFEVRKLVRARVRVTNPNLLLASQMGLVNPASVAWELVPFSFVVDWFVNVGDYLASYTDLLGLSLEDAHTTTLQKGSNFYSFTFVLGRVDQVKQSETFQMVRSSGIPGPTIAMKPFKGFSVRRGLAAISLLVQSLK